jgi:glutaminyl-tRNA synthetase
VRWLGFDWGTHRYHASDYYDQLYAFAEWFIEHDLAYVDSSTAAEMRALRGTLTEAGTPSRYRSRSVAENLDLFRRMKAGEFPDGAHVLRLKIDLASPNINMRDPAIYRIRHASHHRTGDKWCIYPLYDYTHCISDALEGITIRSARSSSRITARSTIGCWRAWPRAASCRSRCRSNTSSPASTSRTWCCRSAS